MENGWFGLSLVFILIDFQSFFQEQFGFIPVVYGYIHNALFQTGEI
jgi:hypothetical protein